MFRRLTIRIKQTHNTKVQNVRLQTSHYIYTVCVSFTLIFDIRSCDIL